MRGLDQDGQNINFGSEFTDVETLSMIYRDTHSLCVQAGSRIHITNT